MGTRDGPDGGEAILEAFRGLRVDYVISSPGSEWPPVWEALARQHRDGASGAVYLNCGHELLAVSIACAYAAITGRMQAVLLHAGAGLQQGAMAIAAARAMEVPMLVMSGEAEGYGESGFDPGSQWYRNLSVVGGPGRLIEPCVKWAQTVSSPATLHESVVRAGELAQRSPRGPVYLGVSMETMVAPWPAPVAARRVAAPTRLRPPQSDIDAVARLVADAERPLIVTETVGPDPRGMRALVKLAERAAIPVMDAQGAFFGNFPKSHPLYLGASPGTYAANADLVLLAACRAPWYPPSNAPAGAAIVAIDEAPLKAHMVYQVTAATHYLEGHVADTLGLLADAVHVLKMHPDAATRRERFGALHEAWRCNLARRECAPAEGDAISIPMMMRMLREQLPDAAYVDETIVHTGAVRAHAWWDDAKTYFRAPSGLGQGLGYALGVKLALDGRQVVAIVGDGTFQYSPVVPALGFAAEYGLPLLIVIVNNREYASMRRFHDQFYPGGAAVASGRYFGVSIGELDYAQCARIVGGHGETVRRASDLQAAIARACESVGAGRTAILDVIVDDRVSMPH